ncbi:hypothetical protein R1flu_012855 [Riccia fluitans]|uniref:Uncharacterized protein n=1 Tax=Riccia fluitans TaxID=41844 RepID=A0ABD1ZBT0_9MARC
MVEVFGVDAFLIVIRATLEETIILSFMLFFLDKVLPEEGMRRNLKKQVCLGMVTGLFLSLCATMFRSLYYTVPKEEWDNFQPLWDGILGLIAKELISLMAFCMIRMNTWRAMWETKLTKATAECVEK